MPLHDDQPDRDGNLSDEAYRARKAARREQEGDNGLHIIPADILAEAEARAEADQ